MFCYIYQEIVNSDSMGGSWEYFLVMQDLFSSWPVLQMEVGNDTIEQQNELNKDNENLKSVEESVEDEAVRLEEAFRKGNLVTLHSLRDFDTNEGRAYHKLKRNQIYRYSHIIHEFNLFVKVLSFVFWTILPENKPEPIATGHSNLF